MMRRLRRWFLALVITLMLIDGWMQRAAAATGPGLDREPSAAAPARR
jgi:hypothetical protein